MTFNDSINRTHCNGIMIGGIITFPYRIKIYRNTKRCSYFIVTSVAFSDVSSILIGNTPQT